MHVQLYMYMHIHVYTVHVHVQYIISLPVSVGIMADDWIEEADRGMIMGETYCVDNNIINL